MDKNKKVYLFSFLGNVPYNQTTYYYKDELKKKTNYAQLAIYELIKKRIDTDLNLMFFLTEDAEEKNYNPDGTFKDLFEKEFGKEILEKKLKSRRISDCKNEEEIWLAFDQIVSTIDKISKEHKGEEVEIYLDITNAFRSIPFISFSAMNFTRYLNENISLKGIYYGMYEKESKENPIIDITPMIKISDWTNSADKFLDCFRGEDLVKDIDETLDYEKMNETEVGKNVESIKEKMDQFCKAVMTNRGLTLPKLGRELKGEFLKLENTLDNNKKYDKRLEPFLKIISKTKGKFDDFGKDEIRDINICVDICCEMGLIQQGYTLLRENITNYLISEFDKKVVDGVQEIDEKEKINLRETIYVNLMKYSENYKKKKEIKKLFRNEEQEKFKENFNCEVCNLRKNMRKEECVLEKKYISKSEYKSCFEVYEGMDEKELLNENKKTKLDFIKEISQYKKDEEKTRRKKEKVIKNDGNFEPIRIDITEMRNDINHAGYRKDAKTFDEFRENLVESLDIFNKIIKN